MVSNEDELSNDEEELKDLKKWEDENRILRKNMEALKSIIGEDNYFNFIYKYSWMKDLLNNTVKNDESFADTLEKAKRRSDEIFRICKDIVNSSERPFIPSFRPIDCSNYRKWKKGDLRNILKEYETVQKRFSKLDKIKPTLLQRFIIGICNFLLRFIKLRLFFK